MATTGYTPRPTIDFQPNVPVTVALKFQTGKECNGANGPRFMFTTTDERVFFLDHEPAHEVEQCARQGGPIVITKAKGPRNSNYWYVKPANAQEARDARPAEPAASARPMPAPAVHVGTTPAPTSLEQTLAASIAHVEARKAAAQGAPEQQPITPAQAKLLAALCVAIDSCVEAKAYAQRRGLPLEFTGEDVRCFANTILINAERGGR